MSKKIQGHTARKRFGQNFLHDTQVIHRIIQAIHPTGDQMIAEIGPGLGALTEQLVRSGCQLTLIELDRDLVAALRQRYALASQVQIYAADALDFDFHSLSQKAHSLRVVGNLPYNISTPLIFHLLAYADVIEDMHFMLQKEVVERLAASPGSKNYGRLSVMVQYFCEVESLFEVGPGAFRPAPKVDSAIVRLRPRLEREDINPVELAALVKHAFAHRRKTLRNNLKILLDPQQMLSVDIDPNARPETLSPQQFITLTRLYQTVGHS